MTDQVNSLSPVRDTDNLRLSNIDVPNLPSDILFPEELNRYFREQIQNLTRENKLLKKTLNEKELVLKNTTAKLNDISDKVKKYEQFTSNATLALQGRTSNTVTSKIVSLSKKIRDLTSELEVHKSRCSKLDSELKKYKENQEIAESKLTDKIEKESKPQNEDQIKMLNDRISSISNKLFETKNQNVQLKNELKLANKILAQEIGDSFTSILKLTSPNSSWRGRAQQILSLQQKLTECQDKLSLCPDEKESNATAALRQMDINRRQIQEQLTTDLSATKLLLNETRSRLEGSRARVKVLETECANFKSKLKTLLDKSTHDDQLIQALTGQIDSTEQKFKGEQQEIKLAYKKLQYEKDNLHHELDTYKQIHITMQRQLDERRDKIRYLQDQLQQKEITMNIDDDHKLHDRQDSSETKKKNENEIDIILQLTEAEKKCLLELVANLDARLAAERNDHNTTKLQLKKQLQQNAKYDMKIVKLELEQKMSKSYLYSRSSKSMIASSNEIKVEMQLEDLKNRLELAEEEILLYKTRLETTEREKNTDLENFTNLLIEIQEKFSQDIKTKI